MKSTTSRVKSLSIEEISIAMRACSLNAEELLQEATLLATAGHSARAFFLYYTACEEMAKFFIFDAAGKRTAQANPPDWKRFWQRLRSHESKLAHIEARARTPLKSDASENSALIHAALDLLFNHGALPRNTGLYVDLDPGGAFRKPSEIDWNVFLPPLEALVQHLVRLARQCGETPDEIERILRQPPTDKTREQALSTFVDSLVRMKAAGVSKDEILKRLHKMFGEAPSP